MYGAIRLKLAIAALAMGAIVLPVQADLNPGDDFQNPDLVTQPPWYTPGLPAWYGGAPADSLLSAIAPPTLGTPFVGTVLSEVYFVNGVDSSGGLGFAYQFALDQSYTFDALESASYAPTGWAGVTIFDTGADDSGSSTAVPPPGIPPAGFANWTDGDPYTIRRDSSTAAPEIRWTGTLGGTEINGGETSSIIWFETDATFWSRGIVTLLDGGVGGAAHILVPGIPEPTGAVLVLIGLASVGYVRRRIA